MHQECTRSALGVPQDCTGSAPGAHQDCTRSAPGLHQECTRSAKGVHQECARSAPGFLMTQLLRAWPPRWHTPGGCHLHRVLLESYTFHRWIEVEMKTFLASKSTAKTHLEKYFVYLFCGYFQTFLFCFSLTWRVRCTLASMKKRFQFSLKSTQFYTNSLNFASNIHREPIFF